MFRWASAQPLPPRLAELMDRAGALHADWFERSPSDVLVFLPPHLVLSTGRLPLAGIQTSYRLLLEDNATGVLLNGERLLNLSAAELAAWQPGEPLPRACPVNPPAPLDAALTSALLAADPGLAAAYCDLDARAERGGAPADDDYGARLHCNDAPCLVAHWNQQLERRQAEEDLELLRLQLLEVEQECERQFLACREADHTLRRQRRFSQQAGDQLQRYGALMQQLLGLQARLL
jgi:hypothetical protein